MARKKVLTPKKIENASKVKERWNYQKHSTEENILQANARLKQFVESGSESPSFKLSQEALETRLPHEVKMKITYKDNKAGFSDYTYLYPKFEGLSPKEKKEVKTSVERFLGSSQSTVKKYEKELRKKYNTFTENANINRRAFTFNDYKDLFEKYSYLFEKSYDDSGKVAIAIVQHIYEDRRNVAERIKDESGKVTEIKYADNYENTKEWLERLTREMNDNDKLKLDALVEEYYSHSYETVDTQIGWKR